MINSGMNLQLPPVTHILIINVDLGIVSGFVSGVRSHKWPIPFIRKRVELPYLTLIKIITLHKRAIMHGF